MDAVAEAATQRQCTAKADLAPLLDGLEDPPAIFPVLGLPSEAPHHKEGLHSFWPEQVGMHPTAHASPLMKGYILC